LENDKLGFGKQRFVRNIDAKRTFGTSVRAWRNRLGISQEKLAERAQLHPTYISSVECGARDVSLENIERLAHALEISVPALFPQPERTVKTNGSKDLVDILLVEDNVDDVALTLRAFKKARFTNRIHIVNNGEDALDYVFCRGDYAHRRPENRPQVILLDLNLPKMSGIDVLRRIKSDGRTHAISVVILTVSQDNYDIAECRQLGADNYIVKPVNFQRLSQATPRLNLDWALVKPAEAKFQNVSA
jgi:CheY-like chemotaxis protein/DNA-binding XRE family transcriptional regulator